MAVATPRRWRLGLRGLLAVIAATAVVLWVVLTLISPTRRLAALLGPATPAYARREAAVRLGDSSIPSWERRLAVRKLIDALEDPDPMVRTSVLSGLYGRGSDALPALPGVLHHSQDGSASVRFSASMVLGQLASYADPAQRNSIRDSLLLRLDDEDPRVQVVAAESLLPLDEKAALPALVRAYRHPNDGMVTNMAFMALRRVKSGHGPLTSILLQEARHSDPDRRLAALDLISQLAPPQVIRFEMTRASSDPDQKVRAFASEKLASLLPPTDAH